MQLKTIESADLSEVMELKSSAVADRVYRVFVLCCMLLGVEIPEGSMVKKPEDPVGDAQVLVDKCKKKLERAQSLPDQPKATDTAEEVKTMLAEKKAAVDEAMAKMSDALEGLETAKNRAEALKVNAITNVPTEREKKAKVLNLLLVKAEGATHGVTTVRRGDRLIAKFVLTASPVKLQAWYDNILSYQAQP